MMKNPLLPLRSLHPTIKVPRRRYAALSSGALGKLNVPTDYSASSYLAHTSSQTYKLHTDLPQQIRSSKTKRTNYFTAVNDALRTILTTDDKSLIFGEDVSFGGVFRCTSNLTDSFGSSRIFNTPLSEQGIIGFAIGLSASGYTALPEIQFADYLFPAFDQLHNEASKMRYRSGGAEIFNAGRMVVRMPTSAVGHGGLYHSQSPEGFFLGMHGITVVIPRSPVQAKGLLIAAARGEDPVVIMEPKTLYRAAVEEVPLEEYELPIGKAEVLQAGTDVTLVTFGTMVYVAESAARAAKERFGVSVEVIDLRLKYEDINQNAAGKNSQVPLVIAAENKSKEEVRTVLTRGGVHPCKADGDGRTPLSLAAGNGHEQVVEILLSRGEADPYQPDYNGNTPIWWAARGGHAGVLALFQRHASAARAQAQTRVRNPRCRL